MVPQGLGGGEEMRGVKAGAQSPSLGRPLNPSDREPVISKATQC